MSTATATPSNGAAAKPAPVNALAALLPASALAWYERQGRNQTKGDTRPHAAVWRGLEACASRPADVVKTHSDMRPDDAYTNAGAALVAQAPEVFAALPALAQSVEDAALALPEGAAVVLTVTCSSVTARVARF